MFPEVIIVDTQVGTLAAILTALEYLLSTLSALSIRAAMHGFWLVGLHRGGKAPLDTQNRTRRSTHKDILGALIGIWLVVGVALVESNLQVGIKMSRTPENSTACVSVYGRYRVNRVYRNVPPYRTTVEPWVLRVASMLDCKSVGIASVGVGGWIDALGIRQNMSAPTCDHNAVNVDQGEVALNMSSFRLEKEYFKFDLDENPSISLFPDDTANLGKDNSRTKYEGSGVCSQKGISNFFYGVSFKLETVFASGLNMSFGLHERVCALHNSLPVRAIPKDQVTPCLTGGKRAINVTCVRHSLLSSQIHSTVLKNVSALFVGSGIGGMSYGCPWAKVLQEYTFIDPEIVTGIVPDSRASLPVLLMLSARAIDGYCERTVGLLGQAALLYSADAVWRNDALAALDRRKRYYAYLIAVSSTQFPLDWVSGEESAMGEDGCFVHEVREATEIPVDWRFWTLMCGLLCVVIVMVMGAAFRLLYTGESWTVGSAQWSLRRLLEEGKVDGNVLVEVVEVDGPKERRIIQKLSCQGYELNKGITKQEKGRKTTEKYEYRVRMMRRKDESSDQEKGEGCVFDTEEELRDCEIMELDVEKTGTSTIKPP